MQTSSPVKRFTLQVLLFNAQRLITFWITLQHKLVYSINEKNGSALAAVLLLVRSVGLLK